jgi:hypothetical protein
MDESALDHVERDDQEQLKCFRAGGTVAVPPRGAPGA